MLIGAQTVGVWLVSEAVDMRKSIDGLAQAVVDSLHRQPLSGEVFVFGNRARDKAKLLWYDRHGFWLAYKRLERARFRWPAVGGVIGMTELTMLLEGIDLQVPRFRRVEVQRVD
ncbi:MAG: IS66 family insertion sequence element accessory protein TnpB [Gemmatimonadales bacterium]